MVSTGPVVKVPGGADNSWLAGFVVAGAGDLVSSRLARGPVVPAAASVRDAAT